MALVRGPRIVRNGLVLHLDAAQRTSYSGSGTTWNDLSGNQNNVTLSNGPVFNNDNGGNIIFDGSDDYVNFYAPNLGNIATVEIWAKLGSGYSGKMFFSWFLYDIWCNNGNLGYNTANNDIYGISSTNVSDLGLVNNWKHYVFEMRSDISYTNNKIYINSSLQVLSQQQGVGENSARRNFNSGNGRLSGWLNSLLYQMPMSCAVFKVYNRALSASEILQNYNTTKGRFNL